MYNRQIYKEFFKRLKEPRRFIQVLTGPRQVGKTTLAQQALANLQNPSRYASADEPVLPVSSWIEAQWEMGRMLCKELKEGQQACLILDEIQKIPHWDVVIKRLWDEDTWHQVPLQVVLLGSSPLLMQKGIQESLAGRFESLPVTHWSYTEMQGAFGFSLEQYIFFGGYPGCVSLIDDENRWRRYILDSLIETSVARDILLMSRIDKPALLRQLMQLGSSYSGQIVSYQKIQGQLQDAGNTTTLAHYVELLTAAGLLTGLQKYSGQTLRARASMPKWQVFNTALMTAPSAYHFAQAQQDREFWGRLVESAVGAYLINQARTYPIEIFYWREHNQEVDFVVRHHENILALEVKSGRAKSLHTGLEAFSKQYKPKRLLHIGTGGISLNDFLSKPLSHWID